MAAEGAVIVFPEDGPGAPGGSGGSTHGLLLQHPTSSDTWVMTHNMNTYPTTIVRDSVGEVRMVDVHYDDLNTVTIKWAYPMSGSVEFR